MKRSRSSLILAFLASLSLVVGCSSSSTEGSDVAPGSDVGDGGAESSQEAEPSGDGATADGDADGGAIDDAAPDAPGDAGADGSDGATGDAAASDGGDAAGCQDLCNGGAKQCAGAQIQQCQLQANGCFDWTAPVDCGTNLTCSSGHCVLACSDQCTPGQKQCQGGQVRTCVAQVDGCYDWSAPVACGTNLTCSGGACVLSCTDQCIGGSKQCSGSNVQTCELQSNGCYDWGTGVACQANYACAGAGQCALACTDQCTQGATRCSGALLQTCQHQATGCLDWSAPASCQANYACSGGACVKSCTDKCVSGVTQCAGAQIRQCQVQADGCTDWSAPTDCSAGSTCTGSSCVPVACSTGETRCNGVQLETCNASHQWQTQQVCAQSCDPVAKQCVTTTTCTAGTRRCAGNVSEVCNSTGTAWLGVESCAVACSAGLCTGTCSPGAKRCNGDVPETCNGAGTAWTQGSACTTSCVAAAGTCAELGLTIDADANQTLDGEHWYDGDVVIKNSSILKVPSGKLVIHAKSVTLDATSQILVTPTGNEARGKGQDAGAASCYSSYCGYTYSVTISGGSGGSYGTTGGSTSGSTCGCSCSYGSCSVSRSAGAVYAIADDEVAAGAPGGGCGSGTAGKGGGALAIFAENIAIQGTIVAKGQDGTSCAGGGSGGGVVLRATNDLAFTGAINTSGGSSGSGGAGGSGVVKLLYGASKTISGSIVGASFQSFMPPGDLSSATHPRQDRWYNDGFSAVSIAWSKPFATSAGYYDKLNASYGYVPAPANASYLSAEAASFVPADLATGTNYFHATTLGPFANVGTVESRFAINVNAAPPTVTSTSHPSQSTWYPNDSPYLAWTLPQADANTSSFYWVLDRFATTMPTTASSRIPMDLASPQNSKQLLLPGNAGGIWYFHIVAQDTMGYLTKSATHFRLQIGSNPGTGSLSGTVSTNTGGTITPATGVTITLNRGVQTTTSGAGGSFSFPNSVSAQDYEIRASKSGFQDAVQNVTVSSGQTTTVNLTLSP